jgi:hypothetical protein
LCSLNFFMISFGVLKKDLDGTLPLC